jgi:hypothetical protein
VPVAVVAFVTLAVSGGVVAMLSGFLGHTAWMLGIALALGLFVFVIVYSQRWRHIIPYAVAAIWIGLVAIVSEQDAVLAERGQWVNAVVTQVEETRSSSTCKLQRPDGTAVADPLGGCPQFKAGDRVRVLIDPEGDVASSFDAPGTKNYVAAATVGGVIFAGSAVLGVISGHRRRFPRR